jgi:hypothetical protein
MPNKSRHPTAIGRQIDFELPSRCDTSTLAQENDQAPPQFYSTYVRADFL